MPNYQVPARSGRTYRGDALSSRLAQAASLRHSGSALSPGDLAASGTGPESCIYFGGGMILFSTVFFVVSQTQHSQSLLNIGIAVGSFGVFFGVCGILWCGATNRSPRCNHYCWMCLMYFTCRYHPGTECSRDCPYCRENRGFEQDTEGQGITNNSPSIEGGIRFQIDDITSIPRSFTEVSYDPSERTIVSVDAADIPPSYEQAIIDEVEGIPTYEEVVQSDTEDDINNYDDTRL